MQEIGKGVESFARKPLLVLKGRRLETLARLKLVNYATILMSLLKKLSGRNPSTALC